MSSLVLGVFKNIYFLIAVPALIVAYRFIKVLKDQGIIDAFQNTVNSSLDSVLYISNNCFPLILNLGQMLSCISQAP